MQYEKIQKIHENPYHRGGKKLNPFIHTLKWTPRNIDTDGDAPPAPPIKRKQKSNDAPDTYFLTADLDEGGRGIRPVQIEICNFFVFLPPDTIGLISIPPIGERQCTLIYGNWQFIFRPKMMIVFEWSNFGGVWFYKNPL